MLKFHSSFGSNVWKFSEVSGNSIKQLGYGISCYPREFKWWVLGGVGGEWEQVWMGGSRCEWEKVATGEGNTLQKSKDDVAGGNAAVGLRQWDTGMMDKKLSIMVTGWTMAWYGIGRVIRSHASRHFAVHVSQPLRSFCEWGHPPGIVIGDKFTSAGGWFQNAKTKENKTEKEKNTHNLLQVLANRLNDKLYLDMIDIYPTALSSKYPPCCGPSVHRLMNSHIGLF